MGRWDPWEQQKSSAEVVLEVLRRIQNKLDVAEKEKSRAYPRIKEEILDGEISNAIENTKNHLCRELQTTPISGHRT